LVLDKVLRGSFWLSLGSIITSFLGFVYWLLVSPIVPPETVGRAATILALESLFLSTISLGIPTGIMRFLGREYARQDTSTLGKYFYSPLIFLFVLNVIAALIFLFLGLFASLIPLDSESVLFALILMLLGMNGWPLVITSFFNSILRTEYVSLTQVVMGLSRIIIGVPLVYFGLGFHGVMIGYVVAVLLSDVLLLICSGYQLRRLGVRFSTSLQAVKESLKAGMATWIQSVLALIGQWFGVIGLRGFVGSYETGTYFVAYSITAGLLSLPINMLSLMFPVLSSMEDGRKRSMNRATRMASAIMYPLAFVLIAYPYIIPSLLGETYLPASTPIMILSVGFLLAPLVNSYTYYAYAVGKYTEVTVIGLTGNVSRLILYLILIKNYSEIGAAVAFALGFVPSLLSVIFLSRRAAYKLDLVGSLKMLLIPFCPYLITLLLRLPPAFGIPFILILPYLLYARFNMITKKDLEDLSTAFLSKNTLVTLSPYLKPILFLKMFYRILKGWKNCQDHRR